MRAITLAVGSRAGQKLGALGAIALGLMIAAPAALATIPSCTNAAAVAAAPTGVTVADIPNLSGIPQLPMTTNGVADIPENFFGPGSPEYCLVTGTVITNTDSGKTVHFGALLPAPSHWNGKFMGFGCTGNCGAVFNFEVLVANIFIKGYPVWTTDEGHLRTTVDWPINSPGVLNEDAVTDFAYRGLHTTIVAGKQFTLNFYNASKISFSYFQGCSGGGRDGMVEVSRFPEDFDGALVGDPYFLDSNITIKDATAQLRAQDALLSSAQLALASQIVTQQCDAVDGVKDGLIQNPALCSFNPETDLPRCSGTTSGSTCFTQNQIDSLTNILTATTDQYGSVIYPGHSVSNLHDIQGPDLAQWAGIKVQPSNLTGPEPWPNGGAPQAWSLPNGDLKYWAFLGEPGYNNLTTLGFTYQSGGAGPIQLFHTIAPDDTIETIYKAMSVGAGNFPEQLKQFIQQGRKLLLYHGYSDGLFSPYEIIQYYKRVAHENGGYDRLHENVRLFMVPGMNHCGPGPGPNNFGQWGVPPFPVDALHDATTAMEEWVERGIAPAQIIATKFPNDDPTKAALRTMPLCPFPAQARYSGFGDVNDAANWTCPEHDRSLLKEAGFDGRQAGADAPLFTGELPGDRGEGDSHDSDHH